MIRKKSWTQYTLFTCWRTKRSYIIATRALSFFFIESEELVWPRPVSTRASTGMSINLYGLLKPVLGLLGLVLWPPECIQESWPSRRRTIEWRFGWLYSSPSPWERTTGLGLQWKRRYACSLISCPHPKYLVLPYTLRKFQATPDLIWESLFYIFERWLVTPWISWITAKIFGLTLEPSMYGLGPKNLE